MQIDTNNTVQPVNNANATQQSNRTPRTAEQNNLWRYVWLLGALLVGIAIGVIAMKLKANANQTVVAINGTVITKDALFGELQSEYGLPTMRKMVNNQLALQFAANKGVTVTAAAVTARFNELKKQPNFGIILANNKMTADEFFRSLSTQMAEEAVYSQSMTATNDEIMQYYAEQTDPNNRRALFYRPPIIGLQGLETSTRVDAESAYSQIESGSQFDLAAANFSIDGSKANGGHLGAAEMGHSALTAVPAVERTIFALRKNQVTTPLYYNNAWWIFKCTGYLPATTYPFNKVKEQAVRNTLVNKGIAQKGTDIKKEYANFARMSDMQAFWPQYASALGSK
jgi:parvulin-like peptidyl-prolyl isomerase